MTIGSPALSEQTATPQGSTFFATAAEEAYSTYPLFSDGDLWPSCWAKDGKLYTANGDGKAFTQSAPDRYDMAVSVIDGMPPALRGRTIATDVGSNWSGKHYNRKPTGMLCIHGDIYLAFQNLSLNFVDTPAASIARSRDHGQTWTWDKSAPMFGTPEVPEGPLAYRFTTIFFLDYGKDSRNAIDHYVYAYGLDHNWRGQSAMYLARVPDRRILDRAAWEFYAGADDSGKPRWSTDITRKAAVLTDERQLYSVRLKPRNKKEEGCHVIGQGGVVYDAPLKRYLFASWSCGTHEFYEAPQPWGPWKHFLSTDFGLLNTAHNYGEYGTSIPSRFISADGKTMYLQSNVWGHTYLFALRKLFLEPYTPLQATNGYSAQNLALTPGTRATSKSTHRGVLCAADCSDSMAIGMPDGSEDDLDGEAKTVDWWGYTWPQPYHMNRIVYRTGDVSDVGGWYAADLRVQVRQNFEWKDVEGATITPRYPYSGDAVAHATYTFTLPEGTWGDGVRIIGRPGGASHFTSISQLAVYNAQP